VFEVKISVTKSDTTLRPGMTTSNAIIAASIPGVLSVPLEAVSSDGGLSFVYKKNGGRITKQQIETGAMNDNEIVVRRGLTKDDHVLLSVPSDKTGISESLIPGLKPQVSPATSGDAPASVTLPSKPKP
jgi:multidrug efflux pump subunit AcrA (membrane-fusion protein)